jgi:hypothetical protein
MILNSRAASETQGRMIKSPASSSGRRHNGWWVLGATLLAWLSITTLGISPATAATYSRLWSPGFASHSPATNYTAQVFRTGALYPTPTPAIWVPGPVVGRSPARATYQTVRSTTYIQKWNGAAWVVVGTPWYKEIVLAPGSGTVRFATTDLATGPGTFKVVIQIVWSDQYGTLGSTVINYTHSYDYKCGVSYCVIGPGYFQIG